MDAFRFDEKYLSRIPALQVLVNLGYQYLTPAEALAARGGKAGNVLLEEILRGQLKARNRIQHKGATWLFSEENSQSAIQRLKNVRYRDHNTRFFKLLGRVMPDWEQRKQRLESAVL